MINPYNNDHRDFYRIVNVCEIVRKEDRLAYLRWWVIAEANLEPETCAKMNDYSQFPQF